MHPELPLTGSPTQTVLETTAHGDELRTAGELELSRDEDSVMSLALGGRKGRSTYLYAGINSSPASIANGTNEHLRTLTVEQSKGRSSSGGGGAKVPSVKVAEVARTSMFTDPDEDTYQRVVRVTDGMGVASTAMGKKPQLAVFDTSAGKPKLRGVIDLPREAEDMDIIRTGTDHFQVSFCYRHEIYVVAVGKEVGEPELVFAMSKDDGDRASFRSIRYISPQFILAVSNMPRRSGVIINGIRLPTNRDTGARIAATARIPRAISATALAVTNLTPPGAPGTALGDTQFVVAVAGNDSSLSLYTLEHKMSDGLTLLTDLYPFHTVKESNGGGSITALAFSTFSTPKTHLRPQSIKLASSSLQKSVAVHSIPLRRLERVQRNRKAPPPPVRYVVAVKSKAPSSRRLVIVLSLMVVIMAILGQAAMEMMGRSEPIVHVHRVLPSWYKIPGSSRSPRPASNLDAAADNLLGAKGERVVGLGGAQPDNDDGVARHIRVGVRNEGMYGAAKAWEELAEEQKEAWRDKLSEQGAWTRDMGDDLLKGIVFEELAEAETGNN